MRAEAGSGAVGDEVYSRFEMMGSGSDEPKDKLGTFY